MNEKVRNLLNEQVNKELFSAYLYLDIANYYEGAGLDGFGNWFRLQAQEERDHAMLIMQYMANNAQSIKLLAIDAPNTDFTDFAAPLAEALKHEKFVTASINTIYDEALKVKEFKTVQFLDWFIAEQVEEEKNADDLITKYRLYAADGKGLYQLNAELKQRVYSPPSLVLE